MEPDAEVKRRATPDSRVKLKEGVVLFTGWEIISLLLRFKAPQKMFKKTHKKALKSKDSGFKAKRFITAEQRGAEAQTNVP